MRAFVPAGLVVEEESQVILHEADQPDLVGHLLDADVLAGEDGRQVDLSALEANTAALSDGDGVVVKGVAQLVYQCIEVRLKILLPHAVRAGEQASSDSFKSWRTLLDSKETLGPLLKLFAEKTRTLDRAALSRLLGEIAHVRRLKIRANVPGETTEVKC